MEKIASMFGSQAVVASIDYRYVDGERQVFISHGSKPTGKNLSSAALNAISSGAG